MSDGPQRADVLVADAQPSPMDLRGPMASVSSSVDPHAESLRHSADSAPVALLSCSTAGQGCGTADARPQHPLPLGQCPLTNPMFASLQCATPALSVSCNNRSGGMSQSQHHGLAGMVNSIPLCAQFEHSEFHLSETTAIESIQRRAAMIHMHLTDDAAQAVHRMLATSLPQRMRRQHVAQV